MGLSSRSHDNQTGTLPNEPSPQPRLYFYSTENMENLCLSNTNTFCCLLTINQKDEIISNPIPTLRLGCELLFFCNKKTFTFQTLLKGLGRLWWVKRLHCKRKSLNSASRIHTQLSTCYQEVQGRVPRNPQVGQPHSHEEIPDQTSKTWSGTGGYPNFHMCMHMHSCTYTHSCACGRAHTLTHMHTEIKN